MWSTMGPDRPTYGLTKNAGTALFQQIAKDTDPNNMQVVSFHPGGVLTESARTEGYADSGFDFDDGEPLWSPKHVYYTFYFPFEGYCS